MQALDVSEGAKLYQSQEVLSSLNEHVLDPANAPTRLFEDSVPRRASRELMKDGVWLVPPEQRPLRQPRQFEPPPIVRPLRPAKAALPWFAVQTMSNREPRVYDDLYRLRHTVYLPTYRETRRWADRNKSLDIPLFRGYLFVQIENTPEYRLDVLSVSGATRIVGIVTEQEIEAVKKMLDTGARPYQSANPLLKVGCRVRVRSGSLKGIEGIFLRQKGQGRLIVSIDLLRQGVSTEMDSADVEVLG